MDLEEFEKSQSCGLNETCCRASWGQCFPSKKVTQKWVDGDNIYLTCDHHAPGKATPIDRDPLLPENFENTVSKLSGPGFAKLRSRLGSQFGSRLQSTGGAASGEISGIIMQTLDASPENPYIVTFEQFILDPFTGAGQFDLVERDAIRRSFGGASAGGTPILTDHSGIMNWQAEDGGEIIRVGRNPGRVYRILSVEDPQNVTLSGNITLPSSELTLTMDGKSEVTIATKSGFPGVTPVSGWSYFQKPITGDKVFRVDFVPGGAGDGIYSIRARALYGGSIDPVPNPEVQ